MTSLRGQAMATDGVVEGLRRSARRAGRQLADSKTRAALRGRLLHPYRQRRFGSFGHGSVLHKPTLLAGSHKIYIGEQTAILTGCWVSVARREWRKPNPTLVIGDRVTIQPLCTISAAESRVIEDDVTIGSFSLIIDSNHRLDGPNEQLGMNRPISAPVRIGRGTQIGERVAQVVPPTLPWLGPRVWARARASYRRELAPSFLAAWARADLADRSPGETVDAGSRPAVPAEADPA